MTLFDWLAAGIIAACVLTSMWRGFVSELLNLSGWFIAFICARLFAEAFADVAFASMQPRAMAYVCGFIAVFLLTRLAIHFLRTLLNIIIDSTALSGINRIFGALLGGIKGVLFVTLAVLAASLTDLPQHPEWQHAVSAPYFQQLADLALPYLPETFHHSHPHYPE